MTGTPRLRGSLALGVTLLAFTLSGCAQRVWIKKSDLEKRTRVVIDSSAVVELRARIDSVEARCRADSIKRANVPVPKPVATGVPDSVLRARDTEITQLKEQLAKATEELERIKRRLANPRQ